MTENKKNNMTLVITKRELGAYFTSPIAYLVIALFLIATGFIFYSTFFINQRAELKQFFQLLPFAFTLFIPALTMKLFAEEHRSGSIETLMTLPVTETQVVMGKYFAAVITSSSMLVPTLFYIVTLVMFGKPDFGPVIGGYLGSIVLCAVYSSIGIFASSITKNQIIAFFTAFGISGFFTLIHLFMIFLPGPLVKIFDFFAFYPHFSSISRGIIDSRDIIFFLSVIVIFLMLTIKAQDSRRSEVR